MNHRLLALVLALTACGSSSSSPPDAGPTPDGAVPDASVLADAAADSAVDAASAEAGADAPPSADLGADAVAASPVKFVLRNETGKIIYLQQDGYWELIRGDRVLRARDGCGTCNCDEVGCAVCGRSLSVVVPLEPGATQAWEWDGLQWDIRPGGKNLGGGATIDCEYAEPAPAGPVTVQVRYSFTKEDRPPETLLGPTIDLEQTIQLPVTADVVLIAR